MSTPPFAALEVLELRKQANMGKRLASLGGSAKRIFSGKDMGTREIQIRNGLVGGGIGGAATAGAFGIDKILRDLAAEEEEPSLMDQLKDRLGERGMLGKAKESIPDLQALFSKGAAADPEGEEEKPKDTKGAKDEEALRNRHLLLVLKRALQGGAVGTYAGGAGAAMNEGGLSGGQGALIGLIGGGLAGGTVGAAEGGVKRKFGLDPLLQTVATARRP